MGRAGILDRMPVSEKELSGADMKDDGDVAIDEVHPSAGRGQPAASKGGAKDLMDLNDLLDDGPPAAAAIHQAVTSSGGGDLMDMLDLGGGAPAPAPSSGAPAAGLGDLNLLGDIFGGFSTPLHSTPPCVLNSRSSERGVDSR